MNFGHEGIKALVLNHWYTKKNSLARNYPDDFRQVPDNVILLAATAVRIRCLHLDSFLIIEPNLAPLRSG